MSNATGDSLATPVTRLMANVAGASHGAPAPIEGMPGWLKDGRYLARREIAAGGMGRVYLVYDHELEREIALKVLLQQDDPLFTATFVEEARAVGHLEHPGVMPVYDIGLAPDGTLYFTMKYVEGQTLAALIQRLGTGDAAAHAAYPFSTRVRIIVDLAEALAYAHAQGVLHRDIKPSNIMIGPFGEVTLMDWGLAIRTRQKEGVPATTATPIARLATASYTPTMSAGTPGYMPPEALTDPELYNERSDLYSLGVVMYELFTLQNTYPGRTGMEATLAALDQDPIQADLLPSSTVQGRVPKEIALIIRKAMSRDPENRYGGARALGYAIQQYEKGEAPVVCVHTGLKRAVYSFARLVDQHGHLVIIILAILLATPVLLALIWFLARHH